MNTAMILAAGRGERLRPLTLTTPKAMCLIQGRPAIEHHIEKLASAGFTRIVINHAYLGDCIYRHLGDGARWGVDICYSPEPPGGLETGGGIVNALPLLKGEPFFVVNADIFTDAPFHPSTLSHCALAHLILVPTPSYKLKSDFGLDNKGYLTNKGPYTFSGMAYYHPDFFKNGRFGRYSLTPMLRHQAEKKRVTGEVYRGRWVDIGTLSQLERANQVD